MEFTPPKRCRASYPGCGYLGRCLRAAVDDQSSVEVFQVRALLPGISKRIAYWQRAGSYCVDACLVWWPSTMPTARFQIEARRAADDAVSKAFSAASRGAQSPSKERPGPTAERMFQEFFDEGFESRAGGPSKSKSIIEVHSHVALLGLMRRGDRIRYKVTKTATYRKALDLDKGRVLQLRGWRAILDRLGKKIKSPPLTLFSDLSKRTLCPLKPLEDLLDAFVCASMGIQCLENAAIPLRDAGPAIWVPKSAMVYAKHGRRRNPVPFASASKNGNYRSDGELRLRSEN